MKILNNLSDIDQWKLILQIQTSCPTRRNYSSTIIRRHWTSKVGIPFQKCHNSTKGNVLADFRRWPFLKSRIVHSSSRPDYLGIGLRLALMDLLGWLGRCALQKHRFFKRRFGTRRGFALLLLLRKPTLESLDRLQCSGIANWQVFHQFDRGSNISMTLKNCGELSTVPQFIYCFFAFYGNGMLGMTPG